MNFNLPTDLSGTVLPSVIDSLNPNSHPLSGYRNKHLNKKNIYLVNNIDNEVIKIKQRNAKSQVNYLKLIQISELELQRSHEEIQAIKEDLNEEDITDILSIKKLISVYKHIFEIFSYFIGEPYFEWTNFREKLNLHEVKFKMAHLNVNGLSARMVNQFLNKVSKDKRLNEGFVNEYKIQGANKIFKWIKAVFRIFLHNYHRRNQNKSEFPDDRDIDEEEEFNKNNSSILTSNNVSPFNQTDLIKSVRGTSRRKNNNSRIIIANSQTKIVNLNANFNPNNKNNKGNKNYINKEYPIEKKYDPENINIPNIIIQAAAKNINTNSDLFFTQINPNINTTDSPSQLQQNIQNNRIQKEKEKENNPFINFVNPPVNKKFLKLEINANEDKRKKEKKTLNSLPFMNNKSFPQLREYFNLRSQEKEIINSKHYDELQNLSLKNPVNAGKILNFISKNKIKEMDDNWLKMFLKSLTKEDEEEIKVRFRSEGRF